LRYLRWRSWLARNAFSAGEAHPEVFARAKRAIRAWKMFEMEWLELGWTDAAIEVGSTVGVLVGHYGFWSLNPCRIAYVLEEGGRVETFGFGVQSTRMLMLRVSASPI
jgi:uncharacterized protein (UPF0548 family)